MTTNTPEWESVKIRLNGVDVSLQRVGGKYYVKAEHYAPPEIHEIQSFDITSLLDHHTEAVVKVLEGMKGNKSEHTHMGGCYDCSMNKILDSAIAKVRELDAK